MERGCKSNLGIFGGLTMKKILSLIKSEYERACNKFPEFEQGKGEFFGVSVLTEEVGESGPGPKRW